jgi:hypothetical protein
LRCRRANLLLLRMRGQTRSSCPAMTYLSALCREPKCWPLAREGLLRRRLTFLEAVWRSSDPPVHYMPITCACGESERGRAYTCLVGPGHSRLLTPVSTTPERVCPKLHRMGEKAKPSVFPAFPGGFAVGANSRSSVFLVKGRSLPPALVCRGIGRLLCRAGQQRPKARVCLFLHRTIFASARDEVAWRRSSRGAIWFYRLSSRSSSSV